MPESQKILGTSEAWESGALGMNPNTAQRMSDAEQAQVDAALGIKLVSLRLPETLVSDLTDLANSRGVGFAPLIRTILHEYLVREYIENLILE